MASCFSRPILRSASRWASAREYLVHDGNFLLPLVGKTKGTFALRYILADKAYLSEQNIGRLHEMGVKAVVPVKKRSDGKNMKQFYEAFRALVSDPKSNLTSHFLKALQLDFAGLEAAHERTPTVRSSTTRSSPAQLGRTKHSAS
jgi:hypothetical protein